ncbi:hypothetical protein [Chlamydiifrater volucris]|uniref:hypothetical protein n=1 Tax=Chlamydiifrater volucris TaxID=2681470 RepID=UPI001BCC7C94|nr:hypothetical protein [Chlamydiifrater volucris]
MSISKSTEAPSPGTESSPVSLQERTAVNLSLIQQIILQQPPHQVGQRESLYNQINAMVNQGFGLSTIAEAMVISRLSVKTLLMEDRILSQSELKNVLSCCQDLSEASGSGSQQPPPAPQVRSPEEIMSTSQQPSISPEELQLPLKKRKTIYETFIKQVQEPPEIPFPEAPSIEFLLDTAQQNAYMSLLKEIPCPNGESESHECRKCSMAKQAVREKKRMLFMQLGDFLSYTNKTTLAHTLITLVREGKIASLESTLFFSRLQICHVLEQCKVGDEVCLPGKKHPAEHLQFLQSLKDTINEGIHSPLTQKILDLWDAPLFLGHIPSVVLVLKSDNTLGILSEENCFAIASKLEHRYYRGERAADLRFLSSSHMSFLAKITFATVKAMKLSKEGFKFFSPTKFGWVAIEWKIVERIYNILFASNRSWRVEIPASGIASPAPEDLRFSPGEIDLVSLQLQKFTQKNCIVQSASGYLPRTSEVEVALQEEVAPSEKISETSETTPSAEEPPKKKSRKTRHTPEKIEVKCSDEIVRMENPSPLLPSQEEDREALLFLLSEIARVGSRKLTVKCPKSTEESKDLEHVCSHCLLAKQFIYCSPPIMRTQLSTLLSHTTQNQLAEAILNLPSSRNFAKLIQKPNFDNLSVAILMRDAKIGDSICLPGGKSPLSQIELYCIMDKVISSGLKDPITSDILNIWKKYTPSLSHHNIREVPSILTLENNQLTLTTLDSLIPLISSTEQLFTFVSGQRKRNRCITSSHAKFLITITLHTLKAFSLSATTQKYLASTPQGTAVPKDIVEHTCGLIMASHPTWGIIVLPTKASPDIEILRLPLEETTILHTAMQRFCRIHRLGFRGRTKF